MQEFVVTGIEGKDHILPGRKAKAEDFLRRVFKGKKLKIENLGCPEEFVDISPKGYALGPQSLFFQTVHMAYTGHYKLALRPEVLAYLIAHEVATAVKKFPDRYRDIFTTDPGKPEINVNDWTLERGNPASDWARTIGLFEEAMKEVVPSKIGEFLCAEFSTTTPATKAASLVAFMDAASPFYTYRVTTMCGIPVIRLDGEPEDWVKLNQMVIRLLGVFQGDPLLRTYLNRLLTITNKLATDPHDLDFWKNIYKIQGGSGGDTASGWIIAFLEFTWDTQGESHARDLKWGTDKIDDSPKSWENLYGISTDMFPSHVSSVPFIWNYYNTLIPMHFVGGVLSVTNEEEFLTPRLSYAVLED
ncbi:MAG: DUF4419 domain-containing protein [Bacteroidota bacterium]|jgi:hypothetical protein